MSQWPPPRYASAWIYYLSEDGFDTYHFSYAGDTMPMASATKRHIQTI